MIATKGMIGFFSPLGVSSLTDSLFTTDRFYSPLHSHRLKHELISESPPLGLCFCKNGHRTETAQEEEWSLNYGTRAEAITPLNNYLMEQKIT